VSAIDPGNQRTTRLVINAVPATKRQTMFDRPSQANWLIHFNAAWVFRMIVCAGVYSQKFQTDSMLGLAPTGPRTG